jgi:hypothetical protein
MCIHEVFSDILYFAQISRDYITLPQKTITRFCSNRKGFDVQTARFLGQ